MFRDAGSILNQVNRPAENQELAVAAPATPLSNGGPVAAPAPVIRVSGSGPVAGRSTPDCRMQLTPRQQARKDLTDQISRCISAYTAMQNARKEGYVPDTYSKELERYEHILLSSLNELRSLVHCLDRSNGQEPKTAWIMTGTTVLGAGLGVAAIVYANAPSMSLAVGSAIGFAVGFITVIYRTYLSDRALEAMNGMLPSSRALQTILQNVKDTLGNIKTSRNISAQNAARESRERAERADADANAEVRKTTDAFIACMNLLVSNADHALGEVETG